MTLQYVGSALPEEVAKCEKYISKKSKKWFNMTSKIMTNTNGEKVLLIKYYLENSAPSGKNYTHDHGILLSKIK